MSTFKIICNITHKINAVPSLHSTVISSLSDVLQATGMVAQEAPFVTAYLKAPRKCCDYYYFFFVSNVLQFLLERGINVASNITWPA